MDLPTAQAHLDAWLEADLKLAEMQSYSFTTPTGQRTVSRSDADKVRAQINYWQRMVDRLGNGGAGRAYCLADFS